MLTRNILTVLAIAASVSASNADTSLNASAEPEFGRWFCAEPANLFDVVFDDSEARINNIAVSTGSSLIVGAPSIVVTASISNRGDGRAAISIDVVGMAAGKLEFAVSVVPGFGYVDANKTEQVTGWVLRSAETAASIDQICIHAAKLVQHQ